MSLQDLNKHLMWQLDRLSSIKDEDLDCTIESEVLRARSICGVVEQSLQVLDRAIEVHKLSSDMDVSPSIITGISYEEK